MFAPRKRTKTLTILAAALLLLGGSFWEFTKLRTGPPASLAAILAPDQAKPSLTEPGAAPVKESVQQPSAEVLSDRISEYHIDVKLDETTGTLTGTETLSWTHPGKKPVNEVYLHLYANAFSSPDTTFMKESGGVLRSDAMPQDGWGSISMTEIRTTDGLSLLHRIQYVQPDDGNIKDKTLVKVRLPQAVQGGETLTLKIGFQVKLPKVFARMGTAGNFVMAGQWFPKMSVYEPAGTRGRAQEGWNLHEYHGNSEFYSDFGIYSVKINVPQNYIVAATGFPTKSAAVKDTRKTYQFYADDVHDFAWAASPDFVYAEEPFASDSVPGVRIKLYLDPAHKDLKDRYFYAAKAALASYSKAYGPYPYSTLSIVVPPADGNGAGGMEYPTLITAFGATSDSPGYDLERTVVHEIGHQYFYGMIASNEFEEPWLDEAFTSYAEDKVMEKEYGVNANLTIQSAMITQPQSLDQSAWKYGDSRTYALNVYTRGKLVLMDIERQIGTKQMNKVMKTYALKYRFKHPTTADFQRVLEQATKKSWGDYFNNYVYNGKMADYAVDSITTDQKEQNGETLYEATVSISRRGADTTPVPILFTFSDGHEIRKEWDGKVPLTEFKVQYTQPLAWVMIDPAYSLLLENKHINNFLKAEVDPSVGFRWNLGIAKLVDSLLGLLSW
ncbi:M1 family metallopeptidase [Paenibacillus physcomitrellae]|uniref:Peptidase M1 n=1 Tax=Paenibacillus physcomitrellae TaxID=1619311 RepID=A0ABQ1GZ15_9BACL|nr:M1 family metallopeptidase [Paenibacillus physcomitrellae]GGA52994.1 peptidase M1 [Paenibacillus physcomitrellae]